MITSIHYKNYKALQDTTLPLGRFTLIVGANGTGKSTALKGIKLLSKPKQIKWEDIISIGDNDEIINIKLYISDFKEVPFFSESWNKLGYITSNEEENNDLRNKVKNYYIKQILDFCVYNVDTNKISSPVPVQSETILEENGYGLAGVLDQLRDSEPERFEELNKELNRWFYEYDRILFEVPEDGKKSFLLRTAVGKHKIRASELSDGTLLALTYLTIAYLPNPPKIVAFEEPEKGIHPRLLRHIQEAMYRLAYPENYGEKRDPIQVIATTHSPYLLDLYKDNPEEIVISSKDGNGVHFERLVDKPHIEDILRDAPLGEIWYSGVLGGVPTQI